MNPRKAFGPRRVGSENGHRPEVGGPVDNAVLSPERRARVLVVSRGLACRARGSVDTCQGCAVRRGVASPVARNEGVQPKEGKRER